MKLILLMFILLVEFVYSQNDLSRGVYQYYDDTKDRELEDDKVKVTKDNTALILSSVLGFGAGHGYIRNWKLFGGFFSTNVVGITFFSMGISFYQITQDQVLFHGFEKGDVGSFFNERYITDKIKLQRKVFYYGGISLLTLGLIMFTISRIWEIIDIAQYSKTIDEKKEVIKLGLINNNEIGLKYSF